MESNLDVLAFAAHPDDVELMCAATLIKLAKTGYRTGVISLTAAELGSRGTPATRRKEFEQASQLMRLTVGKILDIPDSSVQINEANKIKVISEIRRYRPQIVFAPYWKTRHPDHSHCSHLVREAAFFAGLKQIKTGQSHYRPMKVIYYMELYDFSPSFVVDVSDSFDEKIQAIQAYRSQFYSPENKTQGNEATYISTESFLKSIITRGEYWGDKIGASYGEPFYIREPLKIDDPVAHFQSYRFAGLM
jgi:bacillithiol biosynthesis deacetylase BshB1